MKKQIEIGQKLYVSVSSFSYNKPNLHEYTVTRMNTVSIYAKRPGDKFEIRFKRRDLSYSTGWGDVYKAYLTEDEYWKKIERINKTSELRKELVNEINNISLEKLESLKNHLSTLK